MSARLLVVDDNDVDRERITRLLGGEHTICEARTAGEALGLSDSAAFDCILLDYRLSDLDGMELLDRFTGSDLPVVVLTGQGDEQTAVNAMKRGALDYLAKSGLSAASLRRAITHALEKGELQRKIQNQQKELRARVDELARQRRELEASNRALGEREAKLEALLGQLPAVVWSTDSHLVVTSIAGSIQRVGIDGPELLGAKQGSNLGPSGPAELAEAHERALAGSSTTFELQRHGRSLQGHAQPLREEDGRVGGVIGVAIDVTDSRQLERQLQHSQKMEALGKLAGGVAHDFNNILAAILAFSGFVREALPATDAGHDDLDEVESAAHRGGRLVRQLLAFSRQRPARSQILDVAETAAGLLPMLRSLVGENIHIAFEPSTSGWTTFIDPGGLEQVVVNLAVNARDAMPAGGRITVRIDEIRIAGDGASGGPGPLPAGEYVVLSVSDEGAGIPPDVLARVFDPFFSTNAIGTGTGLGLSTCYGVAQQAGGGIDVHSEVGAGTRFDVYLPRAAQSSDPPDAGGHQVVTGGSETVLVVEDDRQVRALVVRALTRLGYDVLEASSPRAAEDIAAVRHRDVALVISDVVMPGMSGPDLARELTLALPSARFLYMTGYAGDALRDSGALGDAAPTLEKPFTIEALARAVRDVLDTPPG